MKTTHTFQNVDIDIEAIRDEEHAFIRRVHGDMSPATQRLLVGARTPEDLMESSMRDCENELFALEFMEWDERLLDYLKWNLSYEQRQCTLDLEDFWSDSVEEWEEYIETSAEITDMLEQALHHADRNEWDEVATIHYNAFEKYDLAWPIHLWNVRWSDIRLVEK